MRALLSLLSALALSGCGTLSYYAQSVGGHLDLTSRARRVDEVLADANSPPALKERLKTAAAIREFASRDLKLPDNGSYRSYAELDRPYAVWNVVAAPEFSLQPVQSCFAIAGCVAYRGYYAKRAAEKYADHLRTQGNDVMVYGVPAYSTLGWFDDPLLSSFMRGGDTETARLVFHELAHQLVYVRDDSTFNESFATTVEQEGVRRWLMREGRAAEFDAFLAAQQRKGEFIALLEATRGRLEAVYRLELPPAALRAKKRAEFDALRSRYEAAKARWGGYAGFERIFGREPNNALLAAFSTYTQLVPAFERLLSDAGGDLPAFYARVKEIADLPQDERSARLAALAGAGAS